jgi:FkbH-like protein
MYLANKKRNSVLHEMKGQNLENWLQSLNTHVKVSRLNDKNQSRVLQLFNKTNQLNVSTRRLTEMELVNWLSEAKRELYVFSVNDKFGDLGIIGLCSFTVTNAKVEINDFILSCRAMGRGIEHTMLHTVKKEAIRHGAREIYTQYKLTERNRPTLDVLRSSDFKENDTFLFTSFDLKNKFNKPSSITISYE